jgi:hypothetical protein
MNIKMPTQKMIHCYASRYSKAYLCALELYCSKALKHQWCAVVIELPPDLRELSICGGFEVLFNRVVEGFQLEPEKGIWIEDYGEWKVTKDGLFVREESEEKEWLKRDFTYDRNLGKVRDGKHTVLSRQEKDEIISSMELKWARPAEIPEDGIATG